jgi:hypothetical protein
MPIHLEPYDGRNFSPAAPVANVELRVSTSSRSTSALLLVDTGADATLLPRSAIERLGVSVVADQTFELVGFDGTRSHAPSVELDLIWLRKLFRGRYPLVDDVFGVLGRDVLNHLILTFDGPAQQWSA